MIVEIIAILSNWALKVISKIGYWGIFLLMALDSANIPIPSEITMPFSGFLSVKGDFHFWLVVAAGTMGSFIGSLVSYFIALWLKGPLEKLINKFSWLKKEYTKAENFFHKHGQVSVFWGRLIPVIRTFISFPAGIFKVKFFKFSALTFIGSFIWSLALTWVGYILGENWTILGKYFHKADYFILAAGIVLVGIYIFKFKKSKIDDNH